MLVFLIEVDTRIKILSIYDANAKTNLGHEMKFSILLWIFCKQSTL